MKTTVLAAALLALLTSPAARIELAMISTRGSDAAVAAPTPPPVGPAPPRSRRRPQGLPVDVADDEARADDTRALRAYLGHRNIQHTVRYTELSPTRFKNVRRE